MIKPVSSLQQRSHLNAICVEKFWPTVRRSGPSGQLEESDFVFAANSTHGDFPCLWHSKSFQTKPGKHFTVSRGMPFDGCCITIMCLLFIVVVTPIVLGRP